MDMDPLLPESVWGSMARNVPARFYLAAVLAGHNQKGMPAFSIYGARLQDAGDTRSRPTCRKNCCALPAPALPRHHARKLFVSGGRAYSPNTGIRRLHRGQPLFESYLRSASRAWTVSEFIRRMSRRRFDEREFKRPMPGRGRNCSPRHGTWILQNRTRPGRARTGRETVVKYDDRAAKLNEQWQSAPANFGFGEEALGHSAIAGGSPQGATAIGRTISPNGDFMGASSRRRSSGTAIRPPVVSPRKTTRLNGAGMCSLLCIDEHRGKFFRRADVLESRRGSARHRPHLGRQSENGLAASYQLRRGHARWTAATRERAPPIEALLGNQPGETAKCLEAISVPGRFMSISAAAVFCRVLICRRGRNAHDDVQHQPW